VDLLAPAGLIGALVGLVVGWIDYRIVAGLVVLLDAGLGVLSNDLMASLEKLGAS